MIIRKSELKLVKNDSPVLHSSPQPYDFNAEDADPVALANVMIDRMKELGGIGLSANQVGLNIRMFVMGVGDTTFAVFNPTIVATSTDDVAMDEGCLSFPGVFMKVSRPSEAVVKYYNEKGEEVNQTLHGLTARVFLHEYDHMEGKTFKDRVSKMKWDLAYNRMLKRTKRVIRQGVQKQLVNIANQIKESAKNDNQP